MREIWLIVLTFVCLGVGAFLLMSSASAYDRGRRPAAGFARFLTGPWALILGALLIAVCFVPVALVALS